MGRISQLIVAAALLAGPLAGPALADEIPLDQVPPAVRQTIDREVGNGVIEEVERETKGGRIRYEVEFYRDGREYDMKIDENGKLLKITET